MSNAILNVNVSTIRTAARARIVYAAILAAHSAGEISTHQRWDLVARCYAKARAVGAL